jgi:hypothetical protein
MGNIFFGLIKGGELKICGEFEFKPKFKVFDFWRENFDLNLDVCGDMHRGVWLV